jgi:dehydrogenase/reductase SDR family protein 7B
MSFKNKTVIITGASSGIGEETAKVFLSSGAKVILVSRNKEKMEASFQSYDTNQYAIYPFDLSRLDDIDSFIDNIVTKEGPIDILFNNAGISQVSLFEESDMTVIDQIMQLDYFSVVRVTKSILHHMIANGGGQIATNTSVAGLIPSRNRTAYSSAKFALHGFFDSLRLEVTKHNISITLVAPGRVQTNVGINALTGTGIAYGKNDRGHDKGLSVEKAAHQIVNAIHRKKRLAIIAKWNDIAWFGVILNKFFPNFYIFLAKKINA